MPDYCRAVVPGWLPAWHLINKTGSVLLLSVALLPCGGWADVVLPVNLLVNNSSDFADSRGDVDLDVLRLLQQQATGQLQIQPIRLGDARSWRLLRQDPTYCALSKIKTPERAEFLHFSARPSSIYPPFQLLSYRPLQPQPLDLTELLRQEPMLKIGVVAGRSYGETLDRLIEHHPQNFFQRSGEDAAQTLLQMLAKQRLDGIIEFAATALNQSKVQAARQLTLQPLAQQPVIAGYLVCHRSPQGQRTILKFDQLMQQPAYRRAVVQLHQHYFSAADYLLIESALLSWFPAAD